MIKFFLLVFSFVLLFANIDLKIKKNQKLLKIQKMKKLKNEKEVKEVVKNIKLQEKELQRIERLIQISNEELQKHLKKFNESKKNVKFINKNQKELLALKKAYEKRFVTLISQNLSLSSSLELNEIKTQDDLINKYLYTNINSIVKEQLNQIQDHYDNINKQSKKNLEKAKKLKRFIAQIEKKQLKYKALLELHHKKLLALRIKHKLYQDRLENIIEEQNNIANLLSNLNILKKRELEKEKRRKRLAKLKAQRLKAQKALHQNYKMEHLTYNQLQKEKFIDKMNVRLIGSSTKGVKIKKYYGYKTIAPLKRYKIVKQFGKYKDPVYGIKLFNESLDLKPIGSGRVRAVFGGKIVYAQQTKMLKKVVIIKHNNGLHTVYAHLDSIPEDILNKRLQWVQRGTTIGRANELLKFQVIQKNKYINPLQIIR